ncbi:MULTISPECIES: HAD family hydrolase [unclassified Rothia (in: high G+C Gram-positive bacteria)]|uniref:HAD family hydrolase n=1 Tax=unclassified Rothia (in: high G+C Gram-positive bacteria) TaxID=2689056 RepID=UPI001959ECE9|nr:MULTISPECIES: HAD family hydrolase [unclassified Rothia (in: high G+C Gram-positive bacteria)]MBM7051668.1 HAD family hydrolase [Rothia sp. ZJ1223]QRZ61694.1 HAD family hydrolase [Rothia sp. ZJ932]
MIKLIASDIDGTLIGHDFAFRPRTLDALAAARTAGVHLVLVTGRPYRWLSAIVEQMGGYDSYAICSNGAVTYHLGRQEIIETRTLTGEQMLQVHSLLKEALPGAHFTAETIDAAYIDGDFQVVPGGPFDGIRCEYGALEDAITPKSEIIKYLVRLDEADPAELLEKVRSLVGQYVSVTHAVPGSPLIEMAQLGLNKGCVLEDFAAARGIDASEVAAFGDMPNDTEMLLWAGHGYALESGAPAVQAAVGRTCPPFDEDGVAQVIEQLLDENR